MKTVVSVLYGQGGPVRQFLRVYGPGDVIAPMSTADAICIALDELEAGGVPVDSLTSLAIVAKRGIGADSLLPPGHEARVGLGIVGPAPEGTPCAA